MRITIEARSGDTIELAEGDRLVCEFNATAVENRGGQFRALANLNGDGLTVSGSGRARRSRPRSR